jgi:MtrB/PioB family decaheme-associated outer membrane protein
MKIWVGLLATCAASAVAIGLGLPGPARAADAWANPVWWSEGFAEVGGRIDLNNPDKTTLGKFYEYRDLRPGVFGNFYTAWHRNNDPYDIEIWGKDIGWDDQAFGLDLTSPGSYYLTFGWDETPHVYSRNAKTLYDGVGGNNLTIPSSVSSALNGTITVPCGGGSTCPSSAAQAIIDANSRTINLAIRRDTASVQGRWTPNDDWDVYASYSHMHRHGTQALGAVSFSGPRTNSTGGDPRANRSTFEIPRPIDDTTQNAELKAEYSGSTTWGKRFNVALAGNLSIYDNSDPYVIFQNPWNPSPGAGNRPLNNLYSLEPNNQAQSFAISGGMGLPMNSRYMGTFQYTHMQVDNATLPWTINPFVPMVSYTTPNRNANTLLWNNVLHTDITSDLKSTLRYRYYDYSTGDRNPALVFPIWYDSPDTNTGAVDDEIETRYPRNFSKQNADAELVWRAAKWLSVGAAYDWERWSRGQYRDAPTTNENSGKIFADSQWGWSTVRASFLYGQRRYDYYNFPPEAGGTTDGFRQRDLANRNRYKGQFSWAIVVNNMITVTPNGGFLDDDYQTNFNYFYPTEAGIKKAQSWNAGADLTLNISPDWSLFFSYNYENGIRQVIERGSNAGDPTTFDDLSVNTTDGINTFIIGSKLTIIPNRLYLDANFTYMKSTSQWNLGCTPAGCRYGAPPVTAPNPPGLATYADIHNTLTRLDVQAKYMLGGWAGKAKAYVPGTVETYVKARVLWERNENDSWQGLQNQFGLLVNPLNNNATTTYSIWMGTGNPNYDVVLGMLSFGANW